MVARRPHLPAVAVTLALAGCIPGGVPLDGPAPGAFIAEHHGLCPLAGVDGAATQLTPTIAVTVRHDAWLFPLPLFVPTVWGATAIPGTDAAWFPQAGKAPVIRDPVMGEHVRAYGLACGGQPRIAEGHVVALNAYTYFALTTKITGFAFAADISEGMSGGHVIGDDGAVVGMTARIYRTGSAAERGHGETVAFAHRATDLKRVVDGE